MSGFEAALLILASVVAEEEKKIGVGVVRINSQSRKGESEASHVNSPPFPISLDGGRANGSCVGLVDMTPTRDTGT